MRYPEDFIDKLIIGNCLEVMKDIPDNSIDLVFTDPPYGKDAIQLYIDVARESSRILKPGGIAVFYASDYWFDRTFPEMLKYLDYFYLFHLELPGQQALVFPRNIVIGCKTLMVFSKGQVKSPTRIRNFIKSPERKTGELHKWQQSIEPALYLIKGLSNENDIVLDPFIGSGTTTLACKQLNRRYIGIDISEEYIKIANERLTNG